MQGGLRGAARPPQVKEPRAGSLAAPKVYLTGKGAGKNDDLALAANMLAFWPSTHLGEGSRCLVYPS